MPKRAPKNELNEIEKVVRTRPGITLAQIEDLLGDNVARRTLQHRLKRLVDEGRLVRDGKVRWARYRTPEAPAPAEAGAAGAAEGEAGGGGGGGVGAAAPATAVILSAEGEEIRANVQRALGARTPVGYDRRFLDSYRPNETFYLQARARAELAEIGARHVGAQEVAGTYARQILNRLLVDLSWNSSRLEGNTYSLLDTKRLIEFGQEAEGRDRLEAQMILNHKDAVEFLVTNATDIGFNRYTILNLHAMLANNL